MDIFDKEMARSQFERHGEGQERRTGDVVVFGDDEKLQRDPSERLNEVLDGATYWAEKYGRT